MSGKKYLLNELKKKETQHGTRWSFPSPSKRDRNTGLSFECNFIFRIGHRCNGSKKSNTMKRISRKIFLPLCSQPTHYLLPRDEAAILGTVCTCPDTNVLSYLPLPVSIILCSGVLYAMFRNLICLIDYIHSYSLSKHSIFYVLLNSVH